MINWLITGISRGFGKGLALEALVQAASSKNPPLHLPLGRESIERVRKNLKLIEDEIVEWQGLSLATDFPTP